MVGSRLLGDPFPHGVQTPALDRHRSERMLAEQLGVFVYVMFVGLFI